MSFCAWSDSGLLVRLWSEVSAPPRSAPMRPKETSTIAAQTASTRPGRRVAISARRVMSAPWVGPMARAGDPGDEDVVGVIDEVVASEGIDEVALPAHVGGRDGHELAVASRGRHCPGPGEKVVLLGGREQRCGDQDHRLVADARSLDESGDRCSVADREL